MNDWNQLQAFKDVNACETIEDLCKTINTLADDQGNIQGRTKEFNAERMSRNAMLFYNGVLPPNVVTREFGLRQQAMYLKYCRDMGI